jgi:NADH dehydrogenase
MSAVNRKHVVVVGGGFGGLFAVRSLRRAPVDVTLIDRRNYHLFQPLLYQVAGAELDPTAIAQPLRGLLARQENATVLLAEARSVDPATRRVMLTDGELSYDHLVIATGAMHSYFGHAEWSRDAPGLKNLDDALEIRRRMLLAFEAAEREMDPALRQEWLTFIVVGGGPTGVELTGTLAEISRQSLCRNFRHFDTRSARIVLVQRGSRILPTFHPSLSLYALRKLERLGAQVLLGPEVTSVDDRCVMLSDRRIPARTVLWAAGVSASPLARSLAVPLDRQGRVLVEDDLSVPGYPGVFAIGDLAAIKQADGSMVPGVAPAALQQGRHAAKNIERQLRGAPTLPFRYVDKGSLAAIGRGSAIADRGGLRLHGFGPWSGPGHVGLGVPAPDAWLEAHLG